MFLLVPAHPGSRAQRSIKQCVCTVRDSIADNRAEYCAVYVCVSVAYGNGMSAAPALL